MGFLGKILWRQPQSLIVAPKSIVDDAAMQAFQLRKGMWVTLESGEIGILTGCSVDGIGEVTMTKYDGTTVMTLDSNDKAVPLVILKPLADLRQAYIEEIPEPRRPDRGTLAKLGYINRPEA